MNIKHLSAAGLSLALIFTVSHSGLGSPTPPPSIFGSGSTPSPKIHVSAKDAAKLGITPSPKIHVSAKDAAKLGITPSPKVHVSAKDAVKLGLHPSSSVPGTGGSSSSGGGAFPGGGMGGGGGHGSSLVIVPIVLPYPNAVVQAEPGQIILPAGSHIPESVAQLDAETQTNGARGCSALTVSTLWNGSFGPYSKVNMAVEARNCRSNHRYGIALFSSDSDAAKSPIKIGALQTDKDGYGFQAVDYGPSTLVLNYTVGLYELDGDNMIAGPMTQAWAGKIGSPGTP
jgi:hypothetical protein